MTSFRNVIVRSNLALLTSAVFITAWAGTAPLAHAQEKKAPAQAPTPTRGQNSQVDVNSADVKTLETLPGIGPVLAQRIIDGRPYKTLADLGRVKGLSPAKLEVIKDDLAFGSATRPAKEAAKKEQTDRSTATTQSSTPQQAASAAPQQTEPKKDKTTPSTSAGRPSSKLTPGEKININKATGEELDRLPGIGPAKARAIIDYRTQNGDFKTVEDIQKVKGIKAGEFSKVRDFIKVTD